ncbi:FGGY-family carbohydrate kinase, partial [Pseudomonas sp. KCJK8993]|uniref:FGGY-family carbohydrate kinase n=1 Tax=Pseudomonas sp. KCJK8993 TaxID=3344565 RepID=UPI003905B71A
AHPGANISRASPGAWSSARRRGWGARKKRSSLKTPRRGGAGGGSQGEGGMQLTADIFGLPVERPHVYEASGLGAVIACAVGLGLYPDFATAISAMTRVGAVFEPQPQARQMYQRLYSQVYLRMYRQLKPLYQSIRQITGYPA